MRRLKKVVLEIIHLSAFQFLERYRKLFLHFTNAYQVRLQILTSALIKYELKPRTLILMSNIIFGEVCGYQLIVITS